MTVTLPKELKDQEIAGWFPSVDGEDVEERWRADVRDIDTQVYIADPPVFVYQVSGRIEWNDEDHWVVRRAYRRDSAGEGAWSFWVLCDGTDRSELVS